MRLFVIIPVHNKINITLECLSLLRNQNDKDFEVVVVDGGSTDQTAEKVKSGYPDVHIVKGDNSWWFTRSVNEGCKYALGNGADYILILNNDTWFKNDFIYTIKEAALSNPGAVIGCLDVTKDKPEKVFFSGIKKMKWWQAKAVLYHKGYPLYDLSFKGLHPTVALNGRGTLIPGSTIEKIGFFDEINFPQYASDFDYTLRVVKAGIPCYISWDIVVFSIVGETGEGKPYINQKYITYLKSFFNPYSQTSLKNWYRYYKKHAPGFIFPIAFALQVLKLNYSFFKRRKSFVKNI